MTVERLGGPEKAAVLLLSLGTEVASEVMRHLGESEMRKVVQALARVRAVDPEQIEHVGKELTSSLGGQSHLPVDGRDFAKTVVSRAIAAKSQAGAAPSPEMVAELEKSVAGESGLAGVLEGVPAPGLAALLEKEHPQVAAVVLAHLEAAQAAEIVARLPEEMQSDVVERMARLASLPEQLSAEIGAALQDQVKAVIKPEGSPVGGPRAVAELMNQIDKDVEARVLEAMERNDSELVTQIRALMFTFEDCGGLDNRSLQTLLKEVAREDLLLSLKTASPELSAKIFSNVSSRAAEILKEDLSSMGGVKLTEVEAAQARVVATLRELEAAGKVVIAGKGKGDVLV